jgi:hypothetical protein
MFTKYMRHLVLGLGLVVGIVSCADSPTAPKAATPSKGLIGGLLGGVIGTVTNVLDIIGQPVDQSVYVLRRKTALAAPITVTKTVGYYGGTISIPDAGFTMTIPQGALQSATSISVTAVAGDKVQYEFGPHGLVFGQNVRVRQSLAGTYALNSNVSYEAIYYGTSSTSLLSKLVDTVLEVLKAVLDPTSNSVTFDVRHFSGYLVSSGRMDSGGY